MAKTSGAYETIIRGVSQQVPHQRFEGQHWEQVNMISDPVRGLCRRRGSRLTHERLAQANARFSFGTTVDYKAYRETSFYLGSTEYSLMYRIAPKTAGSQIPDVLMLNKDTGEQLPVVIPLATADPNIRTILAAGFNSVASVGKLVLMAAKSRTPTYDTTDAVGGPYSGDKSIVWVRGGSYRRTYTVSITSSTGATRTAQYTTPSSSYSGNLDTSDIPAMITDPADPSKQIPNPNYQKLINDRVYAYQREVTAWIGTAAAAIQPAAIAQNLINALGSMTGVTYQLIGSTICMRGIVSASADDGGDGTQIQAVAQTVKSVEDLSTIHLSGKVVRVQPSSNSDSAYYMTAVPEDNVFGSQFKRVSWQETAGVRVQPVFVMCAGIVDKGTFYLASGPIQLNNLTGISVPFWAISESGDLESQPLPTHLTREINYIRMYQDRLLICAGSTVFLSRTGDYFNFFRASAIQMSDSDPIEMYALGSEDDVISAGTMLDRNLILFGKQWQYAVSGRESLTPTSAFVAIQSAYKDLEVCPPEASGSLIFAMQKRSDKLTLQQLQTGQYADTLVGEEVGKQLSSYMQGVPQQIVPVIAPNHVFIRTDSQAYGLYVYSYLDANGGQERLFDSWSRWQFNPACGFLLSITAKDGNLYCTFVREGAGGVFICTDAVSLDADLGDSYLDSYRPATTPGSLTEASPSASAAFAVYRHNSLASLLGSQYLDRQSLISQYPTASADLLLGYLAPAYVEPTNPYLRDRDGKAILDSRLTLGNINVTLYRSSGMVVSKFDLANTAGGEPEVIVDWLYRPANLWVLNRQAIADTATVVAGIYQEIRDCRYRLAARNWLPFTVSSIEWQGQAFTRRR